MRCLLAALGLALGLAAPIQATGEPAIRAFPLETIESLGRAIQRQDAAAWVASDALMAKVRNPASQHLLGWIVVSLGEAQRVRFLRDAGNGLEAGYDVDVAPNGKTSLSEPDDRRLTDVEKAMWAARSTALAGLAGEATCRPGYNTVVLKDPEQAGWLVWALAPMPSANVFPVGGHYRFSISADGTRILRRDALSASCMTMDPKAAGSPGRQPAAFGVSHIVSPTPVETHVLVHLQSGMPMIIGAGGRMWGLDKGRIRDMGAIPSAK